MTLFPADKDFPYFPIWTMEFGATYPFEETTPFAVGAKGLSEFRGSHGFDLSEVDESERFSRLPSHARTPQEQFPHWKKNFIRWNRQLYIDNKEWMDIWLPYILKFPSSFQKLEWNCKGEERDIWKYLIQFRASGVRVKRTTTSPSLVAMNTSQIPIIAWERRYITPEECLHLQSMDAIQHLPASISNVFKALGNAVNVDIVELVARALLSSNDTENSPIFIPQQAPLFLTTGDD
jgi:DNA (cytosine-5)-methyltransferase 1